MRKFKVSSDKNPHICTVEADSVNGAVTAAAAQIGAEVTDVRVQSEGVAFADVIIDTKYVVLIAAAVL